MKKMYIKSIGYSLLLLSMTVIWSASTSGKSFFASVFESVETQLKSNFETTSFSSASLMAIPPNTPIVGIPCYVNGNTASGTDAFVGVLYDEGAGVSSLGSSSDVYHLATNTQIGSTWGTAWNDAEQEFYAASVLKRHVAYGPGGPGAIYRITADAQYNDVPSNTVNMLTNLSVLAHPDGSGLVNIGLDPHTGLGGAATPSTDPDAYIAAGKIGLGGLDLSPDKNTLWVMNLNAQELLKVDISTPAISITAAYPVTTATTGITCVDGQLRPWGVKTNEAGEVYIGCVCSGENDISIPAPPYYQTSGVFPGQTLSRLASKQPGINIAQAKLRGYVFKLDETTSSYNTKLDFDLGAERSNNAVISFADWLPWSDNYPYTHLTDATGAGLPVPYPYYDIYPQPLVADMEFRTNGDLVVSVMDRFGLQTGSEQSTPNGAQTGGYAGESGRTNGDILLFLGAGSDAWSNTPTQTYSDNLSTPENTAALGGIAYVPGSSEFIAVAVDPEGANSNGLGVMGFDNIRRDNQDLVTYVGGTGAGVAAKGLALGDIEIGIANQTCNLSVTDMTQTCVAAATNYFTLTVNASAIDGGTQYEVLYEGTVLAIADYGTAVTIDDGTNGSTGTFAVDGTSTYYVSIRDANLPSCQETIQTTVISAPAACSSCSITAPTVAATCNDNNTGIATDDTFTFTLNTIGSGVGGTYAVTGTNGTTLINETGIAYGSAVQIGGTYNISEGDFTLTLTDETTSTCTLANVMIAAPAACSSCGITDAGALATCNDNGTGIASDDYFTVTLNPTSTGIIGTTYSVSGDIMAANIAYSSNQAVGGNNLITDGSLTITIIDDATGTCQLVDVEITAPAACSTCPAITTLEIQQSATTITEICNGESVDLKITHDADLGDLALYSSANAALTANDIYNGDHTVLGITTINGTVSPAGAATMTTESSAMPSGTSVTYYAVFASGNTNSGSGCTPMVSSTLTINPLPTATAAAMTVCDNGTGNGTFDLTTLDATVIDGQTSVSVSWYSDAAANTAIGTPTAYASAATTVYAQVTENTTMCESTTAAVSLILNDVTASVIAGDQTICSGDDPAAFTVATAASGDGALTYQWQSSTTDCTTGFADIAGATSDTYDAPVLTATTYYQVVVTSTLNGVVCTENSNCTTVTINSTETGVIGANQTICEASTPAMLTFTTAATGTALSYQWQSTTIDCNTDWADIAGETATTYSPAALSATTHYRVMVTSTLNGNTCASPTNCATITVITATPTATVSAGPFDICSEDSPYMAGVENVVDLQDYITAGDTNGTWSSVDAPAGSLVGSTFTAAQTMEATTYNFTYTLANNGAPCTDNTYAVQIAVKDCYASIGDEVWGDTDGDGENDETGTEIEDIKVIIFPVVGGVKQAMLDMEFTDTNGNYLFDLLPPGDYAIQFDLANSTNADAADFVFTSSNISAGTTDDTNDSDAATDGCTGTYTLNEGDEDLTADAGIVQLGKLGNLVWEDTNGNGLQDLGEPGIGAIDVTISGTTATGTDITTIVPNATIQTSSTPATLGEYCFTDLPPGDYKVTFGTPTGMVTTTLDVNTNGNDATDSDANAMSMSTPTNIESGEEDNTHDAGFYTPAKLGNLVWEDLNGNGIQDTGEPGIAGIDVTISGTTGDGTDITTVVPNATIQTSSATATLGEYCFTDLPPGAYKVTFGTPTDMVATVADEPTGTDANDSDADPANGLMSEMVTLESGDENNDLDGGFLAPVEVGDFVFVDVNYDGLQDGDDMPLEGVTVTLYNCADDTPVTTDSEGSAITATMTSATGEYLFDNLSPGDYYVVFDVTTATDGNGADYITTKEDESTDRGIDSDVNATTGRSDKTGFLESGEEDKTLDAGFFLPVSVGNIAFVDTNNDGLQDFDGLNGDDDLSLEGVTVTLYNCASDTPVTTDANGDPVVALTTGTDGEYLFDDLFPGDYYVIFDVTTATNGSQYILTTENEGGDTEVDSDIDANGKSDKTGFLSSGEEDLSLDAGYFLPITVGDETFVDVNGDGLQDANDEPLEGVTVTLYDCTTNTPVAADANGDAVIAQITNAAGEYLFEDLNPGDYYVIFDVTTAANGADYVTTYENEGGDTGVDSDVNTTTGQSDKTGFLSSGGEDLTLDAGYYLPAKLGNFVWQDYNDNGIQDAGELGISSVDVTISGMTGNGTDITTVVPMATIATGSNGEYCFTNLPPGEYELTFTPPMDMQVSDQNSPNGANDDSDDSDADPTTGVTETYTLTSGQEENDVDAGYNAVDYGDNPDTYATTGNTGASHVINPDKYLGAGVDGELDGTASAESDGDDSGTTVYTEGTVTAGDDEDGITFLTPLIPGNEACIEVTYTAATGTNYLVAWIDFDGNGIYDAADQLQFTNGGGADLLLANGTAQTIEVCFEVPATATYAEGDVISRFRMSCETGVGPTGQVIGGEVEDYNTPIVKVGNLVWQDLNNLGDQDESADFGMNDISVNLIYTGANGTITYADTTATEAGVNGKYCFLGLIPGTYEIDLPEYPANFQQAPIDNTGDDTTDNDGDNYTFTITDPTAQPTGEGSTGDNPDAVTPDVQDNLTIDIALVAFDYGDLPDEFGTTNGQAGANHILEPDFFLGTRVDAELDGNPDAEANGDNDDISADPINGTPGADDEEGVSLVTPLIPGNEACIEVSINMPTGAAAGTAYFKGWIDFNGDGDFTGDADEALMFNNQASAPIAATNELSYAATAMNQKICFDVPADATFDGGETHFRYRLSREQDVAFDGQAIGGEVEDYYLPLAKLGNLVWREYDEEGDQDEAVTNGMDNIQVDLVWAGLDDDIMTTADNITYSTMTAAEAGVNGKYNFCGLPAGNYQVNVPNPPANMVVSPTNATGNPDDDADPLSVDVFIADPKVLPQGEAGTGDDAPSSFPDTNTNIAIDFAFSALDFGDLPTSFANTTNAENGAYHVINPSICLGQGVDAEVDGASQDESGVTGTGGDDQTVSALNEGTVAATGKDEDGIEFISPMIPGEKAYVRVTAKSSGADAFLNAWIDFDGDGVLAADGSEQIMWTGTDATTYAPTGEGLIAQGTAASSQIMCFEVPADAIFDGAETHVRFRLSTEGGLTPTEKALDGEVEDYYLPMVKVGNLVWRDLEINGQQDATDLGINDVIVELTAPGADGIIGTADDLTYSKTTATDANGQDGRYEFCGLPAGDYILTSYGDGSLTTLVDEAGVNEDLDSDGSASASTEAAVVMFTIADPFTNNLPEDEGGLGDTPDGQPFTDVRNNLEFDFGYQGLDYGDLPNTFTTIQADGGASHVLIEGIFLGTQVDLDIDGNPALEAEGDDTTASPYTVGAVAGTGDDEDGIEFLTSMIPGEKATIAVTHTSAAADAFLNAWIDFNGNETFEANESIDFTIVDNAPITPTKNGLLATGTDITQEFCFNVPATATFEGGETHARFRMSTAGDLAFDGLALNGEVEDYYLPMAKAGNLVWFDTDLFGDENEATTTGINDFQVEMVYAGKDGVLDTPDDIIYTQTTATINGQDGSYYFCGLIDGEYRMQYTAYPEGMISAIFDNTAGDFDDSDADFDFAAFTIENGAQSGVAGENEAGDATNPDNFPDGQTNVSIDFAFVNMPTIGTSLSLQGVAEPTTDACGNFNGIYQSCIKNTGDEPLENIQSMLDFAAADAFGSAYVGLGAAPIIISSTAVETPAFNAAFDGSTTGKNLFDGISGRLNVGEEICVQFEVELRPVDEAAPADMKIQSMVTGGAINNDGTPIPDVLAGLPQFIAGDLSDDGLMAMMTNPESPNDLGTDNDPSPLGNCFEAGSLACNDLVQISVNETCSAGVTPDMILENLDPLCSEAALPLGSWYTVTLMNTLGQPLPNNEITAAMYGDEITVKVEHIVSCNECWGSVVIEDKLGPEFDCSTDPITVDCTADIDAIAAPIATDNCNTAGVTVSLVDQSTNTTDQCNGGVIVTRTYTAIDAEGNQTTENCTQTIIIEQVTDVNFPTDIVWSCDTYANNTNITDASPLTMPGLLSDAEFAGALNATAANSQELVTTGSGVPDIAEGLYCNFAVTHNDEVLSICDSENTFKIIRTWTVLNWCTNSLVTTPDVEGDDNIQIIKVIDITAPVITAENITVSANLAGEHPQPCRSTAALPAAVVSDNCSGVMSVEIYTPTGVINGNGGNIPIPGLNIGTHTITYVATDGCGNTSELSVTVTVVDDLTPTPVCDEITQVAIGANGTATVLAGTFDDGSNDNCGIDYFEVRRMTDNCATPANLVFGESVTFCCADIDTEVIVEFRVVDYYGNANSCMVTVLVEDKLAPFKTNDPADDAILCDDYFTNIAPVLDVAEANGDVNPQLLIDLFGEATYDDNCEAVVTTTWSRNVNTCGEGTITRAWSATDANGNVGQSCSQTINVSHVNDWNVQFPADADLNCIAGQDELDGLDFGEPTIFDDDCELIAVSSEDQIFNVVPDACYRVIRTYTVINWCVYDGDNQDDDIIIGTRRFRDGADGIITYTQNVTVEDEVAPVITNPGTQDYCIDGSTDADADCDRDIQLPEAVVTDCSDDVTVTYAVSGLGTGRNYSNVAPGIYEVIVTATDNCGNQSSISYNTEVRDCKAPTPYCVGGLVVELMPMDEDGDGIPDAGMVEIWASDFNAGSFDNCTTQEDLTLTASIGVDNQAAATANIVFDCETTGVQGIYLYVTDEAGNTDYCLTTVVIESVDNVCPDTPSNDPVIAGAIATENGDMVELTEVHVNGNTNAMMMTTEDGLHSTEVMNGGDYTVSPLRDDDHDNGVTTFDIVLIRQHILTTSLLDSPYKMIAADANSSESITTSDIVLLRQLVLTVIDELPTNTSWRFVDAAYEFPDATNPWAEDFPEITNYNNVDADILNANFVGVKVGDVNGSVQANLTQSAEERGTGEVIFRTEDLDLIAGEEYTIDLATAKELLGAQFTVDFDLSALGFQALGEEMSAGNFGLHQTGRGAIIVSTDNEYAATVNTTLVFTALKNIKLSEVLNISSRYTKAEAYDASGNLLDISLEFATDAGLSFALLQNTPNPWSDKTIIGFNLPRATRAEVRIHDAAGKTLRVIEQSFETGYNEVTLDGKDLGNQAVLFYTITTNTHSDTKSMVRVK